MKTNQDLREVQNDWEGEGFGYSGSVDYMLGSSKSKTGSKVGMA
jgi:hypothetical protein